MTLHIQELEQIGIGESDSMMFGDGKGEFSSQILSTESFEPAEAQRMANRYGICYFAFEDCEDAEDSHIFYRFCDRAGKRCPLKKEKKETKMLAGIMDRGQYTEN